MLVSDLTERVQECIKLFAHILLLIARDIVDKDLQGE